MEIVVTGRCPEITPTMKRHAQRKVGKLSRYFEGTNQVEVVLDRDGADSKVELIIGVSRGGTIVSQCRDEDLYAAIDKVLDKAEKQLTRYKEKLKDKRAGRRGAGRGEESEGPADEPA